MDTFVQLTINGLSNGAILALAALGFVLIYKATGVINFAQGEFLLIAAFVTWFMLVEVGAPWVIGIEPDTVGDWATRRRIGYTTYRDLTAKPEVRQLVQGVVDEVNKELAQVETIKKFELIPKELDHEEGELTATQKVKRAAIAKEFEELIEAMYR